MITVLFLSTLCVICQASGVIPAAQIAGQPQVVAKSSQYFERTFNRLVAASPSVLEAPVIPVAPAPPVIVKRQPAFVPAPPVFTVQSVTQPTPALPPPDPKPDGSDNQNVAIAIATAHAAAPVATILLPPYPFGLPQGFGFIPATNFIPEEPKQRDPEPTTSTPDTTQRPDSTTPMASDSENFLQGLPSDENVKFNVYAPPPSTAPMKPVKLKTSVEVVPVPLQYIAPPPLRYQPIRHIHTFVPTRAKIIIRPVTRIRVPVRIVKYRTQSAVKNSVPRYRQNQLRRVLIQDVEPTTFRSINRPVTKPPRH